MALFKPSNDFADIPKWGNRILDLLRSHPHLTSAQIQKHIPLSTTDFWVVLESLQTSNRIELAADESGWQLTKQQRIRDRKAKQYER